MKKFHIIALVLLAFSIGIIMVSVGNYSSFEGFEEANKHEGKTYKVVGVLNLNKEMEYNPKENPNLFSFYMNDDLGHSQKVIYKAPKPQDFERSEQIVVTGKSKNNIFYADEILMKCPSKYVEDEIETVKAIEEAV